MEAQPGRFSELGAGRWSRTWDTLRQFNERVRFVDFGVALLIAGTIVSMTRTDHSFFKIPLLKEGEVASITIRSPRTLEIEDKDASEAERSRLIEKTPEVYDYDSVAVSNWIDRWKTAIRHHRVNRGAGGAAALSNRLGIPLSSDDYSVLSRLGFSVELEKSIALALAPLWDFKIVQKKGLAGSRWELVDLRTSASTVLGDKELDTLVVVNEAQSQVGRVAKSGSGSRIGNVKIPWEKWKPDLRNRVFEIQSRLVAPNVTLNRKETEMRREAALKEVRPSFRRLEKNEVIVREGERVSKRDAQLLQSLGEKQSSRKTQESRWPQVLFGTFFLWVLSLFVRKQFPTVLRNGKDALVGSAFLICSLAALKLALIFQLNILSESITSVPEAFLVFLIPVAAPAMTLRLLIGAPLTILFSGVHALAASLILGKAGLFGVYILLSCLMGAQFLGRCRTRSQLYKAGLGTAVVCGVSAALLMAAWNGQLPFSGLEQVDAVSSVEKLPSLIVWALMGGLIGGWLSSALTLVMVPIFESLLDYTTDLKLLELARMDHPLLRDLVLKAPGTYHHSIIVGSLVEAGAEAIGANALLGRVGAYYHDIGKIGRAEYFVENQGGRMNPHDNTTPQLSAKIIISHVKEGVQLAESYKLGKSIIEFIQTHHGTGVVSFFFNKAKQEAAQPGSTVKPEDVSEEEFRYPGPKPRTKESAIVALADACEASTRSLVDPTPARLEGMVNKIFMKAFTEGLLVEADITLEELHLVGQAFLRILLGIHHNRIQYPDQEKGLPPKPVTLLKSSNR